MMINKFLLAGCLMLVGCDTQIDLDYYRSVTIISCRKTGESYIYLVKDEGGYRTTIFTDKCFNVDSVVSLQINQHEKPDE